MLNLVEEAMSDCDLNMSKDEGVKFCFINLVILQAYP